MVSASPEESRQEAIRAAARFLAGRLPASGIVPATVVDRSGERGDETVFATALTLPALACDALAALEVAAAIADLRSFRAAAGRFLAREEGPTGLWKFWPRGHPRAAAIPHDLDDSACAAAALADLEGPGPTRRRTEVALRRFAGLRDRSGGVRTWLVPRTIGERWVGPLARNRPFLRAGHPFWTGTEAAIDDLDAGANANLLFLLARNSGSPPRLVEEVAGWLRQVVARGEEGTADKWYGDAGMVRYLIARAFAGGSGALEPALAALRERTGRELAATLASGSDLACATALATAVRIAADPGVVRLLGERLESRQQRDGGFERCPVWYGGPRRTVNWGSREVTTLFALEALLLRRATDS